MSTWSGVAAAYHRSFAQLCAGTIDTLLTETGSPGIADPGSPPLRHLDVGCGTGELALAAAGLGRHVIAADNDPDMVAMARDALRSHRDTATVLQAESPTLPLPEASAEAITANFVVNHAGDPRATVRDLARIAAPSAPIAMTIWPAAPGPHLAAYGEAAAAAGAVSVPSTRLAPELDFPRSVAGLADLAEEAGLRVGRAEELRWTWRIGPDELMAGIAGGVATPGWIHRAQTATVQAEIERQVRRRWAEHEQDGILALPVAAVLVVARRCP